MRHRRFEFDIVTMFAAALIACSSVIILFSYWQNERALMRFTLERVREVNLLLEDQTEGMFVDLEKSVEMTAGVLERHPQVEMSNTDLISYLLDDLMFYSPLHGVGAGLVVVSPAGSVMASLNLESIGTPLNARNMPQESAYAVAFFDKQTTYYYYDKNQKQIGSEIVSASFDFTQSAWYERALKSRQVQWSSLEKLPFTEEKGMATAKAVYDKQGKLLAVVGANLTFKSFLAFLSTEDSVHLLDENGKALYRDNVLLKQSYDGWLSHGKEPYILKVKNERYLVSVSKFPSRAAKGWQTLSIHPTRYYFGNLMHIQKQIVLISLIILIFATVLIAFFARKISRPIGILAHEIDRMKELDLESNVRVASNIREVILLDAAVAKVRSAMRSFTRYIPKRIVLQLLEKGHEIALGGERRDVTLFFSDITDLSNVAEDYPLEEFMEYLCEYFDGMSKVILRHGGVIDKFMGDGMLVFWDAVADQPDHVLQGCLAALECKEFSDRFNEKQRKRGAPEFKTRIGLNSGIVIAGNVGTHERMDYTVIGDVVNKAMRFQQMGKYYRTPIVISEEVIHRTQGRLVTRPLDLAQMKGRLQRIPIYELLSPSEKPLAELYTAAYLAFEKKAPNAKELVQKVLQAYPEDHPSQLLLQRLDLN